MSLQTTLLTSHKGVDLHAATAVRVMRERLEGGERLVRLSRCELHTYWSGDHGLEVAELIKVGRYFNPNKHHFGSFELLSGGPWYDGGVTGGDDLPAGWPGEATGSDLPIGGDALFDRLLGGAAGAGHTAVDVCAFPLNESGPLLTGVVWRLILHCAADAAGSLAEQLTVVRDRRTGLLVNPHLEGWLSAARSI